MSVIEEEEIDINGQTSIAFEKCYFLL